LHGTANVDAHAKILWTAEADALTAITGANFVRGTLDESA